MRRKKSSSAELNRSTTVGTSYAQYPREILTVKIKLKRDIFAITRLTVRLQVEGIFVEPNISGFNAFASCC